MSEQLQIFTKDNIMSLYTHKITVITVVTSVIVVTVVTAVTLTPEATSKREKNIYLKLNTKNLIITHYLLVL